ncbi:hypothetical protein [Streptomyces paludis]|uniref:Uncharacterized protein n=1 Tax=Streptomyces paludis TaxID=2282738 RepID=A0A345HNJ8_9ACTN|nr:hypothetical protein [Streptomyces paludis]AXG78272.1 hypothetical protein DVK44_11780 [Streptomyces paludis]
MPVPDDFDPDSVDPESLLLPQRPAHGDPFIEWLLQRGEKNGLTSEPGRAHLMLTGAIAVEKGLTTPMAEQLATLLETSEDEIWAKHHELGYGRTLD